MSSDDYFNEELPSAVLHDFDVIDAAHNACQPTVASRQQPSKPPPPPREVITVDESDEFDEFDSIVIDDATVKAIDRACNDALISGRNKPVPPTIAGPSRRTFSRTGSKATIQTTLTGGFLNQSPTKRPAAVSTRSPVRTRTSSGNDILRGKPKKTKQWDHTAFAKTGWKQPKSAKGKEGQAGSFSEEEEEVEEVEFEQFPAPFVPLGPPPEMKLQIDRLAAKRWIFPLNQPKRDYQFNIVRKCLFENTLVALPTGLGKTFIAGVAMLNFYNWFSEGKVVFVAPTKPLVAQQIEACHKTCGIPGSYAAELTGQNTRQVRAKAWQEKRVFYMTPQTLMNDLRTDNCDPRDIVLLVIDEAHKGVGDYAYAQVIRYMMAKNPHFRVLALTATPGGKPEAVQAIVDALHISHIEIRDEHSLDLKQYIHKKHIQQHVIQMNEDIVKVRDMLADMMKPMMNKLSAVLHGSPNPILLHYFTCNSAMSRLHSGRGGMPWAFPMLQRLGGLARAMAYLLESSVMQCYICLHELYTAPPKGKQKQNPHASDPKMQAVMQELEAQKARPGGFSTHPKMEKLKMLLIEHFAQRRFDFEEAEVNGQAGTSDGDSRVMVFCSYRQCVEEVTAFLNQDSPMIRAVPFIGQGTDKSGRKGYGQKEQLEIIKKFKAGVYNILISTSIGEEGLDIGEIDMIVCYEAQKTPIRMLQRIGRTGRKREGYVHVLLSEIREERNWDKANENYEDVQRFIIRAEDLELYGDVERLVPPSVRPECVEMVMDIEEYIRDDGPPKRVPKSPSAKAKKMRDTRRNIPNGASTSFVSASKLVLKGAQDLLNYKLDLSSDSDDHDIEAGIHGPRRTASMPASAAKQKSKKTLRRMATIAVGDGKKAAKKPRKKKADKGQVTLSQIRLRLQDDSDDEAIEAGIAFGENRKSAQKGKVSRRSSPPEVQGVDDNANMSPPEVLLPTEVVDLMTPDPPGRSLSPLTLPPSSPHHDSRPSSALSESIHSGRCSPSSRNSPALLCNRASSTMSEPPAQVEEPDMSWLLSSDDDIQPLRSPPPVGCPKTEKSPPPIPLALQDIPITEYDSDDDQDPQNEAAMSTERANNVHATPMRSPGLATPSRKAARGHSDMAPPPVPIRFAVPTTPPADRSSPEIEMPEPTFAVRGPMKGKKRARLGIDSSPLDVRPQAQRRLQRGRSSSPLQLVESEPEEAEPEPEKPKRKKRKFQDVVEAQKYNPWMDVEAAHSGDEYSEGRSEDDDLGSESDRRFVEEPPETQVSASYDQAAVYRQSLMTQAPGGSNVPMFARRPVRHGGGYLFASPARARRPVEFSSSPRLNDSDDYEFGSFLVRDDEEISYVTERSVLSDT